MGKRNTAIILCAAVILLVAGVGLGRFATLRSGAVVSFDARGGGLGPLDLGRAVPGGAASGEEWRININTAGIAQLAELPGIGEALAGRIVEYRQASGEFESIEEIMAVKGIGESVFSKIRDYITVSAP